MRCFSCQCQSFQSESGTLYQKPRPAGRNSLRDCAKLRDGGSSPSPDKLLLCILPLQLGKRTIVLFRTLSSDRAKNCWPAPKRPVPGYPLGSPTSSAACSAYTGPLGASGPLPQAPPSSVGAP